MLAYNTARKGVSGEPVLLPICRKRVLEVGEPVVGERKNTGEVTGLR